MSSLIEEPEPAEPLTAAPGTILAIDHTPKPKRQWVLWFTVVVFVITSLLLAAGWIANLTSRNAHLNERIEQVSAERAQAYDDLIASQENAQRLYDQLLELPGVEPEGDDPEDLVTTPAPTPGATGARGAQGERGSAGADGSDPTPEQIAAAVAAYCAVNGGCRGPIGQTGQDGADGTNGTDGAPGAAGADSTVPGPTGPAGPAGATCLDGYSMQVVWLSIADSQFGTFSRQQAAVCRPI